MRRKLDRQIAAEAPPADSVDIRRRCAELTARGSRLSFAAALVSILDAARQVRASGPAVPVVPAAVATASVPVAAPVLPVVPARERQAVPVVSVAPAPVAVPVEAAPMDSREPAPLRFAGLTGRFGTGLGGRPLVVSNGSGRGTSRRAPATLGR